MRWDGVFLGLCLVAGLTACGDDGDTGHVDSGVAGSADATPRIDAKLACLYLLESTPLADATGVPLDQTVSLKFNTYVNPYTVIDAIQLADTAPVAVQHRVLGGAEDLVFVIPENNLSPQTLYTVTIGTSLVTDDGCPLPHQESFSFTTGN